MLVRAEVSGLLSRDKSKSTLLSINEDVPLNGNMGLTAIFKRTYSTCRPSIEAEYKRNIYIQKIGRRTEHII